MNEKAMQHNPLEESERILSEDFYGKPNVIEKDDDADKKDKPTHYKIICISMYTKDIKELEDKVAKLKSRGFSRANKSQLIRLALRRLDVEDIDLPNV